jgi:DNA topoisomerase-1
MSAAYGKTRSIKLVFDGDTDFQWSAQAKKTEFQGWQRLGKPADLDEESDIEQSSEEESRWKEFSALTPGTKCSWSKIQASPKRTKAAPRFTEATLIRELEKKGIGRPSTFASLVEVLFDKSYVEKKDIVGEKASHTVLSIEPNAWPPLTQITQINLGAEKQKLVPTALGESAVAFCVREFPQLFAYDFTAAMETRLDSISQGRESWKDLCRGTWDSYKDDHKRLSDKSSMPSTSEKVKDFGAGFKAVMSKTGPILIQESGPDSKPTFYTFPPNKTVADITEEEARTWIQEEAEAANMGQFNNKPIVKKKGPYGEYLECDGIRIPYSAADTAAAIIEKFTAKAATTSSSVRVGAYIFAIGQYGPYMYKDGLKTRTFIGIPSNINPKTLSESEAAALYKSGLEAKKNATKGRRDRRD